MTHPSKAERLITLNEIFKEAVKRSKQIDGAVSFDRHVEGEPDEELFTIYQPVGFHRRQQACISFHREQLFLMGLNAAPYVDALLRNEEGFYDIDFFALEMVRAKFITAPIVACESSSRLHFVYNLEQKAHEVVFGGKVIMQIATDPTGPLMKLKSLISAEVRINGKPSMLWVYSTTSDMSLPGCLTSTIIQMYLERYC